MSVLEILMLFGAALLGGALNSVAGGGTFFTFPLLLLTGMNPIAANATSTMALWPGSLASAGAYRKELGEHKAQLPLLVTYSMIGGIAGAVTLLMTPETTFKTLIPYLMLVATVLFTFGKYFVAWLHQRTQHMTHFSRMGMLAGSSLQLLIGFYGGYFGAGIGILMLSMLELMGFKNIHQMNALKTILGSVVNCMAVITFIFAGAIVWPQALLMMSGAIFGGYFGAKFARKLPPGSIRAVVIFTGVTLTCYFFWKY